MPTAKECVDALHFDYDAKLDKYIEKTGRVVEEALVCLVVHVIDPKPRIYSSVYRDLDGMRMKSPHEAFAEQVLENHIFESLGGEARAVVDHLDKAINQEEYALYRMESTGKNGPWKLKGYNSFGVTFSHEKQEEDRVVNEKVVAKAGDHICSFFRYENLSRLFISVSEEVYEATRAGIDRFDDPQLLVRIYFRGWSISDLEYRLEGTYPDWINTNSLNFIGHESVGKVHSVTLLESTDSKFLKN